MRKFTLFTLLLIAFLLTACGGLPLLNRIQNRSTATMTPTSTPLVSPTGTPTPRSTPRESNSLTIWVPPEWDFGDDTEQGDVFRQHVEDFSSQYPSIHVNIRVKALTGPGGILDTLDTAEDAAPLVLPDVVALPREHMEGAAKRDLITSLEDSGELLDNDHWYSFSQQLAHVEETTYGVPFATDVLVFAYKADSIEEAPGDWNSLLETQKALAFPASDPQALVSLAFYESLGGSVAVLNGKYIVDKTPLQRLLTFYQQSNQSEIMPYWLTQYETDQQAWAAYADRQTTQVITWSSNVFNSSSLNTALGAVPTEDGKPFSYATGWMWSVVSREPEQRELSFQFIEFFSEDEFLARLNTAAGFIPPRQPAVASWMKENSQPSVFEQLLLAAKVVPSQSVLEEVGPILKDAVLGVLKDQMDPDQAVDQILDQLERQ